MRDAATKIAKRLGMFRQTRWLYRHLLYRKYRTELDREKSDLTFYSSFIRKNDLVFDVGANYGDKSRVFLKLGARVVAFEPQEDCLDILAARCGRSSRLTKVQAALASMPGTSRFYVRAQRTVSGLIADWGEEIESEIIVPTVTLDQMIAEHGTPLYIKIDVEGYEFEVLKGLARSVRYVSFEYSLKTDHDIEKAINCIDYLASLGEVTINITPAETLSFAYKKWLTKREFLEVFPHDILGNHDYRYGDIFVESDANSARR